MNTVGVYICRLLIGVVLIAAGLAKYLNLRAFARTLEDFGIRSPYWRLIVGTTVPLMEVSIGAGVLMGRWPVASYVASIVFLGFAVIVTRQLIKIKQPTCRCFGRATKLSWWHVSRNLSFACFAIAVGTSYGQVGWLVFGVLLCLPSVVMRSSLATENV